MEPGSFEIFAELSVTMLGFSGITAVLGGSQLDSPFIIVRIKGLLFCAGVAGVASIMPLAGLTLEHSAYLFELLLLSLMAWNFLGFRSISSHRASLPIFIPLIALLLSSSIFLGYQLYFEASNLTSAYAFGISACLLCAGSYFIRVVLSMIQSRRDST